MCGSRIPSSRRLLEGHKSSCAHVVRHAYSCARFPPLLAAADRALRLHGFDRRRSPDGLFQCRNSMSCLKQIYIANCSVKIAARGFAVCVPDLRPWGGIQKFRAPDYADVRFQYCLPTRRSHVAVSITMLLETSFSRPPLCMSPLLVQRAPSP